MRKVLILLLALQTFSFVRGQNSRGKVIVEKITSPSLQNSGGENPTRNVSIYLPPDYDRTTNRYPVIYYLHGFTESDSVTFASYRFDTLLDRAILTNRIRPVIVVIPNQRTLYGGSFYANSSLTGNWVDFTAKHLVEHIDGRFRTIRDKDSRGITGYSMGGGGAIKLGMLYPDTFSVVYGLSPGPLSIANEIGATGEGFKTAGKIETREQLSNATSLSDFLRYALVAMGRAYSPDPSKPPFYCDLPFSHIGDSLVVNTKILQMWNDNMPSEMAHNNISGLKKLRAMQFDWGRNDEMAFIRVGCEIFSQRLENLGISHYAEEYIGTHGNKIFTADGRVLNNMLPFFNTYLVFDEVTFKTIKKEKRVNK
jgi:S-formylglutathione hydrolase FrmB